jgi:hypothetical protein
MKFESGSVVYSCLRRNIQELVDLTKVVEQYYTYIARGLLDTLFCMIYGSIFQISGFPNNWKAARFENWTGPVNGTLCIIRV